MRHEGVVSKHMLSLSRGPSTSVTCYKGYIINEFRFHTRERKKGKKTRNSGVIVTTEVSSFASTRDTNPIYGHVSYYGVLTNIVQLHYLRGNRVILFKCDWWDVINIGKGIKNDEYGFTCLNFERTIFIDEPFVLASQTKQVFYVQNSNEENWHIVVEIQTQGVYDMNQEVSTNDLEPYQQPITLHSQHDVHDQLENDLIK